MQLMKKVLIISFISVAALVYNKSAASNSKKIIKKKSITYTDKSLFTSANKNNNDAAVNNFQLNWVGIYDNYVERIINNDGSCDCWVRPGSCRLEIKSINNRLVVIMIGKGFLGEQSYKSENKYQVDQISPDSLIFSRNDKISGKISGKIYKSKNKYFVTYINEDWQSNSDVKDFEVVKKK